MLNKDSGFVDLDNACKRTPTPHPSRPNQKLEAIAEEPPKGLFFSVDKSVRSMTTAERDARFEKTILDELLAQAKSEGTQERMSAYMSALMFFEEKSSKNNKVSGFKK